MLERAGLIERDIDKQRRPAQLKAENLAAAVNWFEEFKQFLASNFDQLDSLLEELKGPERRERRMGDLPNYVLERVFDAPRQLLWKTWTDPKLLPRWYRPNVETIVHRLELKPGGLWLAEMK